MDHSEYIRIADGSDTAVLLIHGIAGSPGHFEDLIPLIPEGWSVYNILLDGHGKGVAEFAAASMEKWKAQVAWQLDEILVKNKRVVIVGHSMGNLFAIQAAVQHPNRVAGLFLQAVPLRVLVRPRAVIGSLKLMLGIAGPGDKTAMAMAGDSSVCLEPGVWKYLSWTPRFIELLREIRRTRKLLPRLAVPCRAFQSCRDELVSMRACRDLAVNDCIKVIRMPSSGHFSYQGEDHRLLLAEFREMVKSLQK